MYTCLYTKGNKKVTPLLCEKLSLDKGKYKRNLQKASSQIEKKTPVIPGYRTAAQSYGRAAHTSCFPLGGKMCSLSLSTNFGQ